MNVQESEGMGTLGFSYTGLIFLLMLFVPNLIFAHRMPDGFAELSHRENKFLVALERVGQVCVTCCALIFSDFNLRPFSAWSLWLIGAVALMLLYEIAWVRYFRSPTLETFYNSLLGVPCPLAVLPVTAFLLLGIYGRVIWLIGSTVILGVGHIGVHVQHMRSLASSGRRE